jgi:hypothetical protein
LQQQPACLLNDRPPLLLDAIYNGYRFNLLVIYDRSLINLGVLDYVGTKRTEQAVQVASVVRALQSGGTLIGAGNAQQDASGFVTTGAFDIVGNPALPLIVVGDFNAYEFTDGYVDVTGMISGTAIQAENLYWDQSGTYVAPAPPLFDSGSAANPADHYSYNFGRLRAGDRSHPAVERRAERLHRDLERARQFRRVRGRARPCSIRRPPCARPITTARSSRSVTSSRRSPPVVAARARRFARVEKCVGSVHVHARHRPPLREHRGQLRCRVAASMPRPVSTRPVR